MALGLAPGLAWVAFFRLRAGWSRLELAHALWAFVFGGVAALGVLAFRPWAEGWAPATATAEAHRIADAFLVTAPLEEGFKACAVLVVALVLGRWDARRGLILGLGAGLGFASAENAHYLSQPEIDGWVLLARAFTSTLLHAAATAGLGSFVGAGWTTGGFRGAAVATAGVAYAWMGHGGFTLGTLVGGWAFQVACLVVLPAMLLVLVVLLRTADPRVAQAAAAESSRPT